MRIIDSEVGEVERVAKRRKRCGKPSVLEPSITAFWWWICGET
jgi:hypothetical protein